MGENRKSKQNCLQTLNANNNVNVSPTIVGPKVTESNTNEGSKINNNCSLTFSFDQLAGLITNLTTEFTSSIKLMLEKFENVHSNKIEKLEGHIFTLSERCDILENQLDKVLRSNSNLKQLLCESHINKIKEQEEVLSNKFEISGFNDCAALGSDNQAKSPQELMNSFTKATLKLENQINISNGTITKVPSKTGSNENNFYKLTATLTDAKDWSLIFSRINNLKNTPLFLDKFHTKEVKNILAEFKKIMYNEKVVKNNKNVSLKNLTLTIDDNTQEVFSILKSRFIKSLN
jgi:hypothetical protein